MGRRPRDPSRPTRWFRCPGSRRSASRMCRDSLRSCLWWNIVISPGQLPTHKSEQLLRNILRTSSQSCAVGLTHLSPEVSQPRVPRDPQLPPTHSLPLSDFRTGLCKRKVCFFAPKADLAPHSPKPPQGGNWETTSRPVFLFARRVRRRLRQ